MCVSFMESACITHVRFIVLPASIKSSVLPKIVVRGSEKSRKRQAKELSKILVVVVGRFPTSEFKSC